MPIIIPTELRQQELSTFKKLYREKSGIELSDEEAQEKGLQLLRFMHAIIFTDKGTLVIRNGKGYYE